MKKIVVHGVHRSGTSLCGSLLEKSGLWFAEDEMKMPAQPDNPEGFWERLDVTGLNDAILGSQSLTWFTLLAKFEQKQRSPLIQSFDDEIKAVSQRLDRHDNWFLKDPRLSITWTLWKKHLAPTEHLVVHRHPVSIAKSLQRRNNIPLNIGLIFWYHQIRMIASSLVDEVNVDHINLFAEEQSVSSLSDIFNKVLNTDSGQFTIDEDIIRSVIKSDLIHHQSSFDDIHQTDSLSIIQDAWQLSSQGRFSELLLLPDINKQSLSIDVLSDTYSDLIQQRSRLNELERLNLDLEQQVSVFNTQLSDLRQQQVKTASLIKRYKFSSTGILSIVLAKLKLANIEPLQSAYNSATKDLSADDLVQLGKDDSTRFLMLRAMANEPKAFIRKLTFKRILAGLKILLNKDGDNQSARQALKAYSDVEYKKTIELFPIPDDVVTLPGLNFIIPKSPLVSVVIPVYNEYSTTLSCLKSIKKNTDSSSIPYEIIIADDASSDATMEIEKHVQGVRVVRSQGNLGFLENCNNAIEHVRGKYVLLLNNDTNVQIGWLSELLETLQSDESIGVVGSKFVYPDGRLQEAGGIIFSDANGWNYGRFDHPDLPEYNFVRDVDYVSGACLLFSTKHWNSLGGFDTRFVPAYYEDTDFCFQTRAQGLRVVYQPSSVVVHFEGVSHGQDENSGIKKHQVENKVAFREKWSDVLNKDHYSDSKSLFKARSHGKKQKILVFIDHYVPEYDKDAGSKVAQRYIELMVEEGIRVIFIGDNFFPSQPYTQELQSMGVEVLYGKYYENNWLDWLNENCQFIDTIYLNRPHISVKYIDKIRALKHVPYLAYHGADLHYLRVEREAGLGISDSKLSSDQWKKIEYDIMRKCDVSLWLSDLEVELVSKEDPSINVELKPMCWFDSKDIAFTSTVTDKPNLLFVGSFGHPPNLDGLNWFLTHIFPSIIEHDSNVLLTIIGSGCPVQIHELESDNIRVLGYVTEAELMSAYGEARVSIVPLRYGAGVKGKVIESMRFGVPVLTTGIGAEGLPGEPGSYLSIKDSESGFTQELIKLLSDELLLIEKIEKIKTILSTEFSRKTAVNALNKMFRSE